MVVQLNNKFTYDAELEEERSLGLAGDLTFVDSGVFRPDVADVQRPRVGCHDVQRLEAAVTDESVSIHRHQVAVAVSFANPRHLPKFAMPKCQIQLNAVFELC